MYTYKNNVSMSDIIRMQQEKEIANKRDSLLEQGELELHRSKVNEEAFNILNTVSVRESNIKRKADFIVGVKEIFLTEAIYKVYNAAVDIKEDTTGELRNIKRNYVTNFIKENGVNNLIRDFKYATPFLSEMSKNITEAVNTILEDENAMAQEPEFAVSVQNKTDFLDKIDDKAINDIAEIIKQRVADAVNTFINNNNADKERIKEIIAKAQSNTDKAKTEEIKESYQINATRQINDLKARRPKGILETMVYSIAKASMSDEDLKEAYVGENGKIDLDKVLESSVVMYTFLEMLNTSKMRKIDEAYIKDVYKSLAE